jgi:RNA polymerase sigma-70 factor, ECF subfamily
MNFGSGSDTSRDTETDATQSNPSLSTPSRQEWLQQTFQRLERPLVAYAMSLLDGHVDRACDCVQDTFLSLCRQNQSDVEGHVDAWLFRTCRNRAIDHHRQEARMIAHSDSSSLATASDPGLEPVQQLVQQDEHTRLRFQIAQLPTREQEILALRLNQGLSYKQIAEITQLSVSNVGVILHQAIMKLKSSLHSSINNI